jgi:hypothetical protein
MIAQVFTSWYKNRQDILLFFNFQKYEENCTFVFTVVRDMSREVKPKIEMLKNHQIIV